MIQKPPSAIATMMARDILQAGAKPTVEHECILALIGTRKWLLQVIDDHLDEARQIAASRPDILRVAA